MLLLLLLLLSLLMDAIDVTKLELATAHLRQQLPTTSDLLHYYQLDAYDMTNFFNPKTQLNHFTIKI